MTTKVILDQAAIRSAIDWSIGKVREYHPPGSDNFPRENYDLAEHYVGFYTIGYAMTVCDDTVGGLRPPPDAATIAMIAEGVWPYASMDFDAICGCCGAWAFAGCKDLFHGKEDEAAEKIFAVIQSLKQECECASRVRA